MKSKYKKIKYSPGFISALLLLPLCLLYLKLNTSNRNLSGIEFTKPTIYHRETNLQLKNITTARFYSRFVIDDNEEKAKITLDSARSMLKNLIELKDTINGIQFEFKSDSKYWSYIDALDICMYNKSNHFLNVGNNIWVLYPKAPKNDTTQPPVMCDLIRIDEVNPFNSTMTIDLGNWDNIKKFASLFWPSIILFIAMVIFSYRKILPIKKAASNTA